MTDTQLKLQHVLLAINEMVLNDTRFAEQAIDPIDALCDELLDLNLFGKKGKTDPRGNQSKSFGGGGICWTIRRMKGFEE